MATNQALMSFLNSRQAVISQGINAHVPKIGAINSSDNGPSRVYGEKLATSAEPVIIGNGTLNDSLAIQVKPNQETKPKKEI